MIFLKIKHIEKIMDLDNFSYNIVIENPGFYLDVYSYFKQNYEENVSCYDEKYRDISFSKYSLICNNLLDIDVNEKNLINLLYKRIAGIKSEEIKEEKSKVEVAISDFIEKIRNEFPLEICINEDIDIVDILKCVQVKNISNEKYLNRLVDYIKLNVFINNVKILITYNIESVLCDDDQLLFYKEMRGIGVSLINIQHHLYKIRYENCCTIVIDNDLCEFYP